MPLRFKVDEDLPVEVAGLLRAAGHDAKAIVEQGMSGTPDERLWEFVQREQRCFVTADKGFTNAQQHPSGSHLGIILLRLPRESRAGYVRLAEAILASTSLEVLAGSITVVTPEGIRVHRGG